VSPNAALASVVGYPSMEQSTQSRLGIRRNTLTLPRRAKDVWVSDARACVRDVNEDVTKFVKRHLVSINQQAKNFH